MTRDDAGRAAEAQWLAELSARVPQVRSARRAWALDAAVRAVLFAAADLGLQAPEPPSVVYGPQLVALQQALDQLAEALTVGDDAPPASRS